MFDLKKSRLTEVKVHATMRPNRNDPAGEPQFDFWSLLIDGEEYDNSYSKKPLKEKARDIARENAPALIKFENRDGEVFRTEKIEPSDVQ